MRHYLLLAVAFVWGQNADAKLAIKVTVNGEPVAFARTQPMMRGSRILVPLRGVFEKLGGALSWDKATRTVTAIGGGRTVVLPVHRSEATIDGRPVLLDQPAMVIDGTTMVPLRFLGEALGAKVEWLAALRTVAITTGG